MKIEYMGLKSINGSLVVVERMRDVAYEEIVEIKIDGGKPRMGKVIELAKDYAVVQVYKGTEGMSLVNTIAKPLGKAMTLGVSKEILGRAFNGAGKPIDNLGAVYAEFHLDINGQPMNPISRLYPRNYIQTGLSAIDGLTTLIRGQKLPIFSGNGLPHDKLAIQIATQAKIQDAGEDNFAVVFCAMGVANDVADYFRKSFEQSGMLQRVVMFLNLSSDPVGERLIAPRCALTAAEYLAFNNDMHVLVILTDMTSYAEALREISSSQNEIPSRKGFPGYLYSDLASLYERAGMLRGKAGSVTQIPILTMPNDDITHPIPDLTGYITEGQIVLERGLFQKGIFPPISALPSLSRLMKDGIGKDFTREDHSDIANQLFAAYSNVQQIRSLASVIGEDELSDLDKRYLQFGKQFERNFLSQRADENRDILKTLEIGWQLLKILPRKELSRIDTKILDKYYPSEEVM